jgi:hypothetical protein
LPITRIIKQTLFSMKYTLHLCSLLMPVLLFSACKKDSATDNSPTIVKEWNLALSSKNEVPAVAARNETGTVNLQLLSDNSLKYSFTVNGLAATDALTAAHIHVGDPATSGPVILGFTPTFSGNTGSGVVANLRQSFVDSLKSDTVNLYFNAHSTQVPSGLVRAQLNKTIDWVADVAMTGANEVPAVTTTASGIAVLRLTSDKKLYAKVTVTGLETGDTWTAAHIHRGAAGVNGAVMVGIYASAAEFGTVKTITVDDATYASLKNDALYVNAHSVNHASGTIRGQIR